MIRFLGQYIQTSRLLDNSFMAILVHFRYNIKLQFVCETGTLIVGNHSFLVCFNKYKFHLSGTVLERDKEKEAIFHFELIRPEYL